MNSLASRKQLLIAESELNRAQLVHDCQTIAADVHTLTQQARTLTALVSAAASLVSGLVTGRRQTAAPAAEKPSWLQTILKGAQLVGSLWSEFRSPKNNL